MVVAHLRRSRRPHHVPAHHRACLARRRENRHRRALSSGHSGSQTSHGAASPFQDGVPSRARGGALVALRYRARPARGARHQCQPAARRAAIAIGARPLGPALFSHGSVGRLLPDPAPRPARGVLLMVAPYAYVVEYRAVDACFPPDCKIDGSATFGRAESEPQGTKGAYVAFGTDKHELFAKRGLILEPAKDFSFTLPAVQGESVFDMSLAAASASGGSFRAVLEVLAGQRAIASYPLQGTTERFEPRTDPAELGRQEKFFSHVRQALPPRTEPLTLVVRNVGDVPLGIGAPVVLRRVEGRGARQAFMVFFDAVPYPLFEQLYRGDA